MLNQDLWVSLERDLTNAHCCTHFCSVMIYIRKDIVETKEQKENKSFSSNFPQFLTFMGGAIISQYMVYNCILLKLFNHLTSLNECWHKCQYWNASFSYAIYVCKNVCMYVHIYFKSVQT